MSKLKEMRLRQGFSVSKLAKVSNVCRQTIYRIENKEGGIALLTYYKLAKTLNCEPKEIMEDENIR